MSLWIIFEVGFMNGLCGFPLIVVHLRPCFDRLSTNGSPNGGALSAHPELVEGRVARTLMDRHQKETVLFLT